MNTLIYGKPGCNPCKLTKEFFDRNGLPYHYYDITEDEEALLKAATYGFRSLPIVVTENDRWSGMNKEKLQQLISV